MKRNLQNTPSTAHKKSLHLESTSRLQSQPTLLTPSNRRKCTNLSSKISSLRSTIEDLISSVTDKKTLQKSAVQRVCDVNAQLCDGLSNNNNYDIPRAFSVYETRQDRGKDLNKTSVFGEASTHFENGKSQYYADELEQALRVKQALNSQIKSTNQLMTQLKSHQNEHEYLREQSSHNNSNIPISHQHELQENRRLKQQLSRLNSQPDAQYTVEDLWREFCELKEENQRLRQETVAMLKSDQSRGKYYDQNVYSTCAY